MTKYIQLIYFQIRESNQPDKIISAKKVFFTEVELGKKSPRFNYYTKLFVENSFYCGMNEFFSVEPDIGLKQVQCSFKNIFS